MLHHLSQGKFIAQRTVYYNQVRALNTFCTLVVTAVTQSADESGFQAFTGDSKTRTETEYEVKCLYRRDFTTYQREKHGIEKDTEIVVYIPPVILEEVRGTFLIDSEKTKVKFKDYLTASGNTMYEINKVAYKGAIYGSCIYVELQLKSLKQS